MYKYFALLHTFYAKENQKGQTMIKEATIEKLKPKECDSILEFLFNDSKIENRGAKSSEENSKLKVRASISHEIKNPLNRIIAYAELLKKNSSELGEELKRYVENICISSSQLKCLLLDVIKSAKFEYGKNVIKRQCFETRRAIEDILKVFREKIEDKNITLFPVLMQANIVSDPVKLNQILYNLIGNAVKFTNEGGSIDVTSWVQDDRFCFEIKNTGSFINKTETKKIFKFLNSNAGREMKTSYLDGLCSGKASYNYEENKESAGIGLYISKELAAILNGGLEFESTRKKTVFRLWLPAQRSK